MEKIFNLILNNSTSIFCIFDKTGERIFVSENCELISYFPTTEINSFIFPWIHEDEMEEVSQAFKKTFNLEFANETFEYRAKRKNGSFWYASTTIIKNKDENYFLIETRDISWRKINEDVLRASENRLASIFDSTSDRIAVWDVNGNYLYANKAELEHLELARNFVIGQNISTIFNNKNIVKKRQEKIQEVLKLKNTLRFEDSYIKENQDFFDEVVLSPIYDGSNQIYAISVIHRDITNRVIAEKKLKVANLKLQQSNKELEQFAYVASHDLQEPLRAISGYIQLLNKRYFKQMDAKADELIERAVSATERMRNLIQDILTLSRITTHTDKVTETNLTEIVKKVLQNLNYTIESRNAKIEFQNLPIVFADASQMIQLFQNLIANGLKFNEAKYPTIKIYSKQKENYFEIYVEDNGIGIKKQYVNKIFMIFQRLHTREEYPGTGIGLAICKKIVERHNGKISVESEFGKGSKFYFSIPKK